VAFEFEFNRIFPLVFSSITFTFFCLRTVSTDAQAVTAAVLHNESLCVADLKTTPFCVLGKDNVKTDDTETSYWLMTWPREVTVCGSHLTASKTPRRSLFCELYRYQVPYSSDTVNSKTVVDGLV